MAVQLWHLKYAGAQRKGRVIHVLKFISLCVCLSYTSPRISMFALLEKVTIITSRCLSVCVSSGLNIPWGCLAMRKCKSAPSREKEAHCTHARRYIHATQQHHHVPFFLVLQIINTFTSCDEDFNSDMYMSILKLLRFLCYSLLGNIWHNKIKFAYTHSFWQH